MKRTIKGVLRYDGTGFSGWQIQREARTVQGELQRALSLIAGEPVSVQGAARTDAGVHALGQVFSCAWESCPTEGLRHRLSKLLAPEIQVLSLEEAALDFNARFSARGKRYCYALDLGREPDPFLARFAWHIPFPLDLDLVRFLLPRVVGEHDFAGFQGSGNAQETTVRTIWTAEVISGGILTPIDRPDLWHVRIEGNGFLYKMVRNIVGTVVEVARGRFPLALFEESMAGHGPFRGHCAPARGLALVSVFY